MYPSLVQRMCAVPIMPDPPVSLETITVGFRWFGTTLAYLLISLLIRRSLIILILHQSKAIP